MRFQIFLFLIGLLLPGTSLAYSATGGWFDDWDDEATDNSADLSAVLGIFDTENTTNENISVSMVTLTPTDQVDTRTSIDDHNKEQLNTPRPTIDHSKEHRNTPRPTIDHSKEHRNTPRPTIDHSKEHRNTPRPTIDHSKEHRNTPRPTRASTSKSSQEELTHLLRRYGAAIPEIRQLLTFGQNPNASQTRALLDLAGLYRDTLSTLPQVLNSTFSLSDLPKLLNDSGLLEKLSNAFPEGSNPLKSYPAGTTAQPYTSQWQKCKADLLVMTNGLRTQESWALRMLDSWGKPEPSLLEGNLAFLGSNVECRSVHYSNITTDVHLDGNMCRLNMFFSFLSQSGIMIFPGPVPVTLDVCLPNTCKSTDLNNAMILNGYPHFSFSCTEDLDVGDDPKAIIAILVLTIFLALMVVGTLTELCVSPRDRRRKSEFINAYLTPDLPRQLAGGLRYANTDVRGVTEGGDSYGPTNGGVTIVNPSFEMKEESFISNGVGNMRDRNTEKNSHISNGRNPPHINRVIDGDAHVSSGHGNRVSNGDYTDELDKYYPYMPRWDGRAQESPKTQPMEGNGIRDVRSHTNSSEVPKMRREGARSKGDAADLPKWQQFLLAFSLPRNAGKILSTKASPSSIACLHGIRVLSMGWVIFGHVYLLGGASNHFQNRVEMFDYVNKFTFQVMVNATLSVDSFFFMSGLLTCYLFLKECGKIGKVTIKQGIMYYVHRYWRLTPPMMIWIMVVACLVQYVGEDRPGWTDYTSAQLCRDHWWVNLLYIQNLYDKGAGCIGVTWYLANDMQFYIIAPLVMIPWVYRKQLLGSLIVALFVMIHLTSNAWLEYEYNFDLLRQGDDESNGYGTILYQRPWARIGPFAIGLIVGYILYKTKCKIQMNKLAVIVGWFLTIGAILTITLVTYDENKDPDKMAEGWPMIGKLLHETLSRPVWALSLGWIVIACASGHGGFINSILSWEGWLPLSRLTYCAYLIHITIINYEWLGPEATELFTMTTLLYSFFGFYVISYAVAFILAVAVEAPTLGIEKIFLPR